MRQFCFALSLICCLLACFLPLPAQTNATALRVRVEDASGSGMPDTKITLISTATNQQFQAATSEDGYALFSPLAPGRYNLLAERSGFQSYNLKEILLELQVRREVRVTLNVATVAETVEVIDQAAPLQSEQGALGQVIQGSTAVELPLAARRYTELALLSPGVTPSTMTVTTRGPGWLVANGNYPTQNNFLLDGVDNNQGTTNAQALSSQIIQPSPDAIAEFKVQTNSYSAEFGRSAGAVVNVALKSGTNQAHGSGWLYNRDQALAARPWAANTFNQPKPDLRWNQFGGTLGGPLRKDKLFLFGDYEGFRQDFSNTFLVTVPTAAQRLGQFPFVVRDPLSPGQNFPGNAIPASRFDALGKQLIDLYPEANLPGRTVSGRTVQNFSANRAGTERNHKFDVKADQYLTSRDTLMARFSFGYQKFNREGIFEGLADGVGNQGVQINDNQSLATSWTRVLTPSAINVFRFGLGRTYAAFEHASAGLERADEFGFRGFPEEMLGTGGLPLINPTNYNQLGTRNFRPQFQKPYLYQFLDTVSLNRGRHAIKAGFELRWKRNTFIDATRRTPAYDFSGEFTADAMGDLLLGLPRAVTVNTVPEVTEVQRAWSGFVQDDWKVLPNLTLNLGLRYEFATPYHAVGDLTNINFDLARGELITPTDGDPYLVQRDRNNFGPRLGFAWQAIPNRLVVRGGYGLFYNSEDVFGSDSQLALNVPQLVQVVLRRVGQGPAPVQLSAPLPDGILTRFNTRELNVRAKDPNLLSGRIQQWNLALQYQLTSASTFELAYVGNRGANLTGIYSANQVAFGVDGTVPANRPFPNWNQVQRAVSLGESTYDALQLKFERPLTRGVQTLLSYTFARAYDQTGSFDSVNQPQILDRFDLETGPMVQTPRQRLTMATIFQLPSLGNANRATRFVLGGWQLSQITSWRSGLPVPVVMGRTGVNLATGAAYAFADRNGGAFRPDRIGEGHTGISPKDDRTQFLDRNAFAIPTLNTPGNSQRNPVYGPRAFTLDLSLVKRFAVNEHLSFDLRGEAFNLFNNVNFNNPANNIGNAAFGSITSAGDPRIVQLALRARF
ncbi:MAG: TonB-dependent receptor [Bryobacter sp.]|nr:TonB-dependent receptor [Bryobacter sp.]